MNFDGRDGKTLILGSYTESEGTLDKPTRISLGVPAAQAMAASDPDHVVFLNLDRLRDAKYVLETLKEISQKGSRLNF